MVSLYSSTIFLSEIKVQRQHFCCVRGWEAALKEGEKEIIIKG
jgi:hypothetical protein